MMIDAFCFDLDGTLQDSEVLYVEAWQQAYLDKGCRVSPRQALEIVYGRANGEVFGSFDSLFPSAYTDLPAALTAMETHFARVKNGRDIRIASSVELLCDLGRQRPVCIVSGSERRHIAAAVQQCELDNHIEFFIGREDYAHGKPDPDCYLTAARRLGIAPARCLAFEDSSVGVAAAKQAGMYCVALARPGLPPQDVSQADVILEDLADFQLSDWSAESCRSEGSSPG